MEIKSVFDESFRLYGKVLEGYDFTELLEKLAQTELPDDGISYVASVPELESCGVFSELRDRGFGGMSIQIGYCSGRNNTLNCLEYHKSSEFNIVRDDVVLMLGLQSEMSDGKYDTSGVKIFYIPAGTGVELYGTTLHYAPCGCGGKKFQAACVLPRGTNTGKLEIRPQCREDEMCLGTNKWLLAHPDSDEAKNGAYQGLTGANLCI